MKRRKAKADHQADTRGDAWVGLPKVVAKSAAYLSLSPFERAVFWIILEKFNGYNNGEIAISYEERDLVGLFGKDYEEYRGRVGMLAPRLRRRI